MRTDKILVWAVLAASLASCSNDEEKVLQDNLKDTPIVFNVGVGEMTTRAGYDSSNLPPYFFLNVDQAGTEYDYSMVKMTKNDDNTYSPSDGSALLWGPGAKNATFEAYYLGKYYETYDFKYNDMLSSEGFVILYDAYGSTLDELLRKDYLGACSHVDGDIAISGSTVSINFRHLFSKLDVAYTWGDELAAVAEKSIQSATFAGLGISVDIDFNTSTVSPFDGWNNGGGLAYSSHGICNGYVNGESSEIIFAPYSAAPEICIETIINGETRKFYVAIPEPAGGFKSGNRYTMDVSIGGTSAKAGTVSIAQGWESSTTGGDFVIE